MEQLHLLFTQHIIVEIMYVIVIKEQNVLYYLVNI